MIASYLLYFTSCFLVLATLLPLVKNDHWIFRIFEYPFLQKWVLSIAVLLWSVFDSTYQGIFEWIVPLTMGVNLLYLSYKIYPFLPLAKHQLVSAKKVDPDKTFSLMIANVYQPNQEFDRLLTLIRSKKPNLLVLSETDQSWADALQSIHEEYPYRVLHPLDNTYGILLYSQFELDEADVHFLVEDDVPSIFTRVRLPSGQFFQLYAIHPTPPAPQENPRSTERDKEILMIGKLAKKNTLPVVVAGDLNDVAWSYTTQLFQNISGLLDPRRGRGFYNTFHARYPFFRYPLDHVFCSEHFQLVEIEKLPDIGSDHFPMWIRLLCEYTPKNGEEAPEADQEDKELAEEKLAKPTETTEKN
ncbi:endonuclease/exonuclease/phosphatase family protein [Arundinibacter roseus]|uniref:Endonuclease n=1 Tax=Arundinibacter roseus TaxID=2070510 RepID=A0A4V2X949_9BACT|nr:endonuclease/exonuclease/phosphatase family protein [Arundinibacter roseus]TDB62295.1 endonuclease [Arundinibacter roseus]